MLSTALFGLAHHDQGPFGMITTGTMGLISALLFVPHGRPRPLIVGHALFDACSVGIAVVIVGRSIR